MHFFRSTGAALLLSSMWFLLVSPSATFAQIRINEFMASNGTLADEDGDFEDWIELINHGDGPVDLSGWGLSDDENNPFKWTFAEGRFIEPGEHLLVWASGKDREPSEETAGILREVWMGIAGTAVSDLTNHPDFPDRPTSKNLVTNFFEAPTNIADNYGQRMQARLVPPETGFYRFWIASDDNSALYISSNEEPENASLAASVPGWTNPREWDRFLSQRSGPIYLIGGQPYYVAALMKEGLGGDNLAVAWRRPNGNFEGPIPAEHFRHPSTGIHTNFRIASSGEALVLTAPEGERVDYVAPVNLPRDVSYGRQPDGGANWFYFEDSTPGAANTSLPVLFPPAVAISEPRGYKTDPFHLTLTAESPDSAIRYTLDGSEPDLNSPLYIGPLLISRTTTLRTSVRAEGLIQLPPATATWIFLDHVLQQSFDAPEGWPADREVNDKRMDYGMRPSVVTGDEERLRIGMAAIPSISLVTDLQHLFDPDTGIYVNPGAVGQERPVSVELIDPTNGAAGGFQIDAGLRIRGGFSRSINNPKHSFRLLFRSGYGESQLIFPLFGAEGTDTFDKIDLRTAQNYSWAFQNSDSNTFLRDVFSRDSQRDMGAPYTRSRFYHLYLNGQYWGLYQTQERAESDYAATYLGGKSDDWDVIKTSHPGYVTDVNSGTIEAWNAFHNIAINQGFTGDFADNYWRVKGLNPDGSRNSAYPVYLDEKNLSVYMLTAHYTGDPDSPISIWGGFPNNMYGLYNRVAPDGFKWLRHDAEHSLGSHGLYGVFSDTTGAGEGFNAQSRFNPATLHLSLLQHPDYRMQFADLVQRHLFGEGAMTPENAQARVLSRMAEIDLAIIAESARWGRGRTRDSHWIPAANQVLSYLGQRRDILISQFRNRGWFPTVKAPRLQGQNRHFQISADTPFYYTTDGSDPRLRGGGINPSAIVAAAPLEKDEPLMLVERGAVWRYFDLAAQPPDQRGISWRDSAYSDQNWQQGPAVLGFAGASIQNPVATITRRYVSGSSGPQVTTTYFRHTFSVDSPGEVDNLHFEILRDDGAVVYLNGNEVFRTNMPDGVPAYNTYAASVVGSPAQNTYFNYTMDLSYLLKPGNNVLAVEVHQVNATSSDLYFDLSLEGRRDSVRVDIPAFRSDLIVVRSFHNSEWSPKVEMSAGEFLDPGLVMHEWEFEEALDLLKPSFSLGGGELTIVPGPETVVLSNTGSDFESQHLRVNNPLGAALTFDLPTTGYEAITLDFLTRRSGQGAGEQTLSYTVDGETWIDVATYAVLNDLPQAQSFDFGPVTGVADNPHFAVRIVFGLADGGLAGNHRFDDMILRGFPLPETNRPPVVNEAALPGNLSLTAGGGPLDFDLNPWFTDPDGDTLAFTIASSDTTLVAAGLDGSGMTLMGIKAGGSTITVAALDGINPPISTEVRLLVYPAPFALEGANYLFHAWAADNPAGTFPEHMLFLQSDVDDPELTVDLNYAYAIPVADAALSEDANFPYAAQSRSRINGLGAEGIAFINTGRGRDVGSALLALNTTGVNSIDVSWTAQTLLPNSRIYGIRLQGRIGMAGAWTDILSNGEPIEYIRSDIPGDLAIIGPVRLPFELEDQPLVQLQWRYYHIGGTTGSRAQLRLDNIGVSSSGSPGGYAAWAMENFGPIVDPAVSGPNAIPFGDGLPNLLKYALGIRSDERITPGQLEQGVTTDNRLFLRFHRDAGRTDITYLVEASTDLIDWSERLFDSSHYIFDNTHGELHEISLPIDLEPRLFLRLRVTQP